MNEVTNIQQPTSSAVTTSAVSMMMSLKELKERATLVSQIKREIMVDKVHYGTVPGCGDKPTLLKNGAELLCMAFKLASDTRAEINDLGAGHREYTVTTTLMSGGELVATGIGSCSTMESKYRYRGSEMEPTGKPVPKEYWDKKDVAVLGGKGFTAKKDDSGKWMIYKKGDKKLENPDIADVYNTVLKMASKRSLVDAVLKATGGSCEFTQDIEDMGSSASQYSEQPQEQPRQQQAPRHQQAVPQAAASNYPMLEKIKANGKKFSEACEDEKNRVGEHAFNELMFTFDSVDVKGVYGLGKAKQNEFLARLAELPSAEGDIVEAEVVQDSNDPFGDFT